jgi:hypothetical protein
MSGTGPLSLVSTIEEVLGRASSGSGLENLEYGRRDPSRLPRGTLYSQKLVLTWQTNGSLSVGIFRSRSQAPELYIYIYIYIYVCVCVCVCVYLEGVGWLVKLDKLILFDKQSE